MIAENVPENISVCIFMFDEKKKNYYAVLSSIALWAFNSIFFFQINVQSGFYVVTQMADWFQLPQVFQFMYMVDYIKVHTLQS